MPREKTDLMQRTASLFRQIKEARDSGGLSDVELSLLVGYIQGSFEALTPSKPSKAAVRARVHPIAPGPTKTGGTS